jgi:predicted CXXCH cytochrome family protein
LEDDHPVSFVYNTSLSIQDDGLKDPSTESTALGNTIEIDLLYEGRVECASCHDVHDLAGISNLLRFSNEGSALCITCHDK